MVVIAEPVEKDLEALVMRVFLKSIDVLGGLSKLAEYKTLTWLPSLARAVYCVVLREEYYKTDAEIAQKVGLTEQTVRNILRADPSTAMEKLKRVEELLEEERKDLKVHTAGGIAKLAYRLVKEGHEESSVFLQYCERVAHALDIPWAYMVLKRLRGTDFPIESADSLKDKLEGIYIKGRTAAEVLQELEYPIRNPAELLHRIRENLKMHGLE
ncbi:MAG: bacterio-opsin activator [Aquificaceae bacterium]|nr:bacterio-opsin activator [Aquificaceae bacterium]MDW8067250.1 bacterio-opsin activator [Aquificaceae bacterium]MDW8423638.1 bacterio-opsin activator [Aquificaceae bacterium]